MANRGGQFIWGLERNSDPGAGCAGARPTQAKGGQMAKLQNLQWLNSRWLSPLKPAHAAGVFALFFAVASGSSVAAFSAPQRVVSINLCTDQLAILLAAPGQLVSVTNLAQDPASSVMVEQAMAYPSNQGLAEEVYLLKPDLVLAGRFTAQATVSMLERLGIPVVIFDPAYSLDDVRQGMIDMGRALHREAEAQAMADAFSADLSRLRISATRANLLSAATWAANGYTSGDQSLAGEIIEAAGFHHLAAELGMPMGGMLPLEALVMANPDLVISDKPHRGASRAEESLTHPAFMALGGNRAVLQDADWVCGLPSVLQAARQLADVRESIEEGS